MSNLHSDLPATDDLLQRKPFAEKLATVIASQTNPSPLVLSINGVWGDGKSTVFNFLLTALRDTHHLLVVPFNPWEHPAEDKMLSALFHSIAIALGVDLLTPKEQLVKTATSKLGWLGRLLSSLLSLIFPNRGKAAEEMSDIATSPWKPDVATLKARIQAKLDVPREGESKPRRAVVLVDDPDRLDDDELFTLFRLIKLMADFRHVTFVLAMDYEAIAKTVGRRFGGDTEGRKFLEKIVQVPIRLPAIPQGSLRSFALKHVEEVINDLGIEVDKKEVTRFREVFDESIMPRIKTPRAAKQYANVLRFTLGLMPGEINATDVMLLEGIRLYFPELFSNLCGESASPQAFMESIFGEKEDGADNRLAALLPEGYVELDKAAAKYALKALFPKRFSTASFGDETYAKWMAAKRVACDEYFVRYLASSVPETDVADKDIEALLQSAEASQIEELSQALSDHFKSKAAMQVVRKLRIKEDSFTSDQRLSLAKSCIAASSCLVAVDEPWHTDHPFGQVAILAAHCVAGHAPVEERESLATRLVTLADLRWTIEFYRWVRFVRDKDSGKAVDELRRLPEDTSERLGALLAMRVLNEFSATPPGELLLNAGLWHCWHHSPPIELKAWVQKQLELSPEFFLQFVSVVVQWSYGSEGRSLTWRGDKEVCDIVKKFVDVDWLAQHFDPPMPAQGQSWHHDISLEEAAYRIIQLLKNGGSIATEEVPAESPEETDD